ncbi:hypothetical protein [Ferroacidibacillus organovorans]|uniref:Urease accessory protein UreH-like transmembrane domain-containing protein n=1 Tax=Ferroacidibacillus organovorans TaxID=1765683 RepID=A0A117SX49_9BACL|nr:hypothetical protein [Ferroacidibacillus organovorans]KUO94865.1 hypothetical protein ATW55_10705 [Ferroacidibacillus organovorans]
MINLWNPSGSMSLLTVLLTALLLGMVHGITPDEHTWPITFSYSVGSYSTRGGMRAGFAFSLAFTVQRALMSELSFVALKQVTLLFHANALIYVVVGLVMALSGAYILRLGRHIHWLGFLEAALTRALRLTPVADAGISARSSVRLALLHGFIAGFGTGAFAVIVYTVLAPQMPSAFVGFLPGLFFGIGTMIMQIAFGGLIGFLISRMNVSSNAMVYIARHVSGQVLFYGGLVFLLVGSFSLIVPTESWGFTTGIHVHNLHQIGVGFFLAVIPVFFIAGISMLQAIQRIKKV